MKKLGILFASVFLLGLVFQSCNNGKTYAEMKEEEREAIKRFIEREDINVISFEQFQEQDSTTNVDENQFVLFSETGVYMQIVEEGNGERLKDGRYEILVRYVEEQITFGWNRFFVLEYRLWEFSNGLSGCYDAGKKWKIFFSYIHLRYNVYSLGYTLCTFRMVDSIQLHKGRQGDFRSF